MYLLNLARLAFVFIIALIASGCVSDKTYTAKDEIRIFEEGLRSAKSGSFFIASRRFEEFNTEFPYSELSEDTMPLLVYSKFRNGKAEEVAALVDVYLELHPSSPDRPYYLFLKALAYYSKIRSYKTSEDYGVKVLETIRYMRSQFPNSPYTLYLDKIYLYVVDAMYGHKIDVAYTYHERGFCIAALRLYDELLSDDMFTKYRHDIYSRSIECLNLLDPSFAGKIKPIQGDSPGAGLGRAEF